VLVAQRRRLGLQGHSGWHRAPQRPAGSSTAGSSRAAAAARLARRGPTLPVAQPQPHPPIRSYLPCTSAAPARARPGPGRTTTQVSGMLPDRAVEAVGGAVRGSGAALDDNDLQRWTCSMHAMSGGCLCMHPPAAGRPARRGGAHWLLLAAAWRCVAACSAAAAAALPTWRCRRRGLARAAARGRPPNPSPHRPLRCC
jgi:hypothetical protein